ETDDRKADGSLPFGSGFAGLGFRPVEMQYEIQLKTLGGKDASLADYRGKALLIVNVASKCGLTPQYRGLQALHDKYAGRGLAVLGFPCNQFGAQEPGTPEEIAAFCST